MTDAHCHVSANDPAVRELLVGRDFFGVHPWELLKCGDEGVPAPALIESLRSQLLAHPRAGVGEIGLDRLKVRDIPDAMRAAFDAQLDLALELNRPIVLHGAKCWGQVTAAVRAAMRRANAETPPPMLFHGFSRSDGLIPDIVALGGFISVGPAVLNDHAVNYRALVRKIPRDRLLVETDRTAENAAACPAVAEVLAKTAEIIGVSVDELERLTDANAARLFSV